jgi:hypothetical protein
LYDASTEARWEDPQANLECENEELPACLFEPYHGQNAGQFEGVSCENVALD